jgi:hypothetical protein
VTIDERIEHALVGAHGHSVDALTSLVHALHAEGLSKREIGLAYHHAYRRYQDADRDDLADAVADVLDVLTGWCSVSRRILPDEPDVKL